MSAAARVRLGGVGLPALTAGRALGLLVFAGGVALRVWIYRSNLGAANSDEAVVGLMALHALHGHFTTFFWGSSYGGTQEVLLTVPVFALAGVNYLALRVVPIALTAVSALLVWRVGRRTIGEPGAAIAAGLLWLWPPFELYQLTHQRGFSASDLFYCSLLLLLGLRLAERPSRLRACVFGLALGLAFWETVQIVPIAVPLIAWIVWIEPRALRQTLPAALLALAGASPWIVWNLRHDWASLAVHSSLADYEHSLRLLASPILPMTLGLRAPFAQTLIVPSSIVVYALYAALIALFAYGAVRVRRRPASLLYVVAAAFVPLYAIDRLTASISGWPQYTIVVTPVIALLLAQLATRFRRGAVLLALAATVSAVSIPRMEAWFREPQPVPQAPRDISPLIATLDRLGLDRVYADYWVAYRLDFATRERIVAVESQFQTASFAGGEATPPPDPGVRYRPYQQEVAAAPVHGFVFFRRTDSSLPIIPLLEHHGYRRVLVGPFIVYAPSPERGKGTR